MRLLTFSVAVFILAVPAPIIGQELCTTYQLIPQTTYEQTPVKVKRWSYDTVYETKSVTEYKPVWTTEKRERRTTVLKPVTKTRYREDRYTVLKPVTETKYRDKVTEETVYETATEMRREEVVVEKPVIETEMREEKHIVRKPVVEKMMRVDTTTTYRPVIETKTELAPANLLVPQVTQTWPRLRALPRGYYYDPTIGQTVFRRGGLHWVEEPRVGYGSLPALVPQQVQTTGYVPQTSKTETPVEVTRYVEQVETRKVPVQVHTTRKQTVVREIPVEVRRPKTIVKTERVPYEETRYVEEEVVRRVPITEMSYEEVVETEPYNEQVCNWVAVTKQVRVPSKQWRLVEVDAIKHTPRTVMMKVPVDQNGAILAAPTTVTNYLPVETKSDLAVAESTAIGGAVISSSLKEPTAAKSVMETSKREDNQSDGEPDSNQSIEYHAKAVELKKPASKLLFPEQDDSLVNPVTDLTEVRRPEFPDSKDTESGNESAFSGGETQDNPGDGEKPETENAADRAPAIEGPKTGPDDQRT